MKTNGALSGITVLDLSRLLPGPFCSMILADHGARVIAVENKKFMADGLFLKPVNRNKEHLSLDLKTPEGKEIFTRLAKKADVIIEGFRPGVVERLGVDYHTVSRLNPGIVYCAITGYGQTGPYRDMAGHDVNYLGIAGVLDLIGEKNRPPSIPGVQVADIAGGGMNAAIGILLALFARQRTGKGQYIDISMTDAMVSFLPTALFFQELTGRAPKRSDFMLSHRYACYNTYETADKRFISIGAVEYRFWQVLCETLDIQEFTALQYDEQRREEIIDVVRTAFKKETLSVWEKRLGERDICWAPVNRLSDVFQNPHLKEREMVMSFPDKDGKPSPTLGVPVKLSDTPGSVRTPPVDFGESSAAILRELGYSEGEIRSLSEMNVI